MLTQGETIADARTMIHPALRDWLELYVEDQHTDSAELNEGARAEPLDLVIGA